MSEKLRPFPPKKPVPPPYDNYFNKNRPPLPNVRKPPKGHPPHIKPLQEQFPPLKPHRQPNKRYNR